MKYVIIGDIHGRKKWESIVKKESNADVFIFLGDYFDPYGSITSQQLIDNVDNFENIIKFKKENSDKVKLLIGNHDLHYACNISPCSRYSRATAELTKDLFRELIKNDVLQLCYVLPHSNNNIWASHAGFTKTWLQDNHLELVEDKLNDHFKKTIEINQNNPYAFIDKEYYVDPYGDDVYQGPLWVRFNSLSLDGPIDIYQIVGHTQNNWQYGIDLLKVTPCDSLAWDKYYVYEDISIKDTHYWKFTQRLIDK